MSNTLLTVGLGCIIAAIIGGGLKAFGMEIPLISSVKRQLLLCCFGFLVLFLSFGSSGTPPATESAKSSMLPAVAPAAARPNLTYGTWTVHNATDESGANYSNSTLKFTSQKETPDGLTLQGVFTWRLNNTTVATEEFHGQYMDRTRQLVLEGVKTVSTDTIPMPTGSYSAIVSADERTLVEGRWGQMQQGKAIYNGRWDAKR